MTPCTSVSLLLPKIKFFAGHFISFARLTSQISRRRWSAFLWNLFFDDTDIDETWENFTTLIHAAVKDVVPIATSKGRRRSPWITREIMNVSRKKNRMYRKAVAHKNNVNLWNKYKDLRALVKRMTKTSYNDYIQNLSDDCKLNILNDSGHL